MSSPNTSTSNINAQAGPMPNPAASPAAATPADLEGSPGFQAALAEARAGLVEGGIPIGAALVSASGALLERGRNRRMQQGSAILHAEMDCFEAAGRLPASAYRGATCFSTLQPCDMCTGLCLLYGVSRVVIGENETFSGHGGAYLAQRGVEVVNLDSAECKALMGRFIAANPRAWNEDIGVDEPGS